MCDIPIFSVEKKKDGTTICTFRFPDGLPLTALKFSIADIHERMHPKGFKLSYGKR